MQQSTVPTFRVTTVQNGNPLELQLTASQARALSDELLAGVAQLKALYGGRVQTSALAD